MSVYMVDEPPVTEGRSVRITNVLQIHRTRRKGAVKKTGAVSEKRKSLLFSAVLIPVFSGEGEEKTGKQLKVL